MKTTKIVGLLAALCLVTSCFAGGTLAKYVTTGNGSDQARVAKWGVTISTTGVMFGDAYKDEVVEFVADEDVDTITVQADTEGTNVVAPGTNGTLAAYAVTGAPEVDTEVTYGATLTIQNWEVDGDFYCPIVFTIDNTANADPAVEVSGLDYTSATDFEDAVEAAITGLSTEYHTNENLNQVNDDLSVTWAWPFEGDNVKDTALGDAAAAPGGTPATIALATSATITQID